MVKPPIAAHVTQRGLAIKCNVMTAMDRCTYVSEFCTYLVYYCFKRESGRSEGARLKAHSQNSKNTARIHNISQTREVTWL